MERKTAKRQLTPDKYLSKAEVRALRKAVEEKALADAAKGRLTWVKCWMMIDLVLKTGMRVAELASVRVGDFYLGRESFITVVGKGDRERKIMLPTDLVKHVKHYIQVQQLGEDDYLLNTRGRKFTTMGLQQQFKRAARAAQLDPQYSIHSCRHTYATYLYEKEKDLRMVQQQLGHADPSTTAIYAAATKERILSAVNGLYDDDE